MRIKFERHLNTLTSELITMGSLCEEAILGAEKALALGNIESIQYVQELSEEIRQTERTIERRCLALVLHEQPVAKDLHLVSAALKMITDMKRIGDQAQEITEIVAFLNGRHLPDIDTTSMMAEATRSMLSNAIQAFVARDVDKALGVVADDDIVDSYFNQMKSNIIHMIANGSTDGELALDLLIIAKYFERIGDHATNIAEWIVFSVTGQHEDEI
ncbi:MAG: phosphate signaling complex protein PhoU [Schaalia turicensis]